MGGAGAGQRRGGGACAGRTRWKRWSVCRATRSAGPVRRWRPTRRCCSGGSCRPTSTSTAPAPTGVPRRRPSWRRPARATGGTADRERLHLRAAQRWAAGDWAGAARSLEQALLAHPPRPAGPEGGPGPLLLPGRPDRSAGRRGPGAAGMAAGGPGWGYVQGMYAFGLEENGRLPRRPSGPPGRPSPTTPATSGRSHALAHVHEMAGRRRGRDRLPASDRPRLGAQLLRRPQLVAPGAVPPRPGRRSTSPRPLRRPARRGPGRPVARPVDAASLLWRLALFGVDVADRAARLTADVLALADEPVYVFNDWHAIMALGLARPPRGQRAAALGQPAPVRGLQPGRRPGRGGPGAAGGLRRLRRRPPRAHGRPAGRPRPPSPGGRGQQRPA